MKIGKSEQVSAIAVSQDGATNARMRMLLGPQEGAPNFHMRQFLLAPGGCTPKHTHAWEHEMFILAGAGAAVSASGETPIEAGDFLLIPGGELHQIVNRGSVELKLLCFIPASGACVLTPGSGGRK